MKTCSQYVSHLHLVQLPLTPKYADLAESQQGSIVTTGKNLQQSTFPCRLQDHHKPDDGNQAEISLIVQSAELLHTGFGK